MCLLLLTATGLVSSCSSQPVALRELVGEVVESGDKLYFERNYGGALTKYLRAQDMIDEVIQLDGTRADDDKERSQTILAMKQLVAAKIELASIGLRIQNQELPP